MAFNSLFSAIFEQIARKVVEDLKPQKDGKAVSVTDVKSICDRVIAQSLIEVTFNSESSKVVHKPVEEYNTCSFVLVRGDREGEVCGKKARTGYHHCHVHEAVVEKSKIAKVHCQHVMKKGKNPGKSCGATAMKGKTVCSKHATTKAPIPSRDKVPKPKATSTVDSEE